MFKFDDFKNTLCGVTERLLYILLFPSYFSLNYLLSLFILTTHDNRSAKLILVRIFVLGPVLLLATFITLPVGIMSFLYRIIFYGLFWDTCYKIYVNTDGKAKQLNSILKDHITVSTFNICAMPEALSRFNNLPNVFTRIHRICQIITESNNSDFNSTSSSNHRNILACSKEFPDCDILCFQEVWDRVTARYLISLLRDMYPFIVYDCAKHKFLSNYCLLGSGLFLASKFPILNVHFECFKQRHAHCKVTSMGVLSVKMLLKDDGGNKSVGYISTTHLQSYPGEGSSNDIHSSQLTDIQSAIRYFRTSSLCPDETILFDILSGDFNFDNMSPSDSLAFNHPLITDEYIDPGSSTPGQDFEWTIGTECRQSLLHEHQFSSPEELLSCLNHPVKRRYCVCDANLTKNDFSLATSLPECDSDDEVTYKCYGARRRIDRICYNERKPLNVLKYETSTAFAKLSDHLAVSMTFKLRS